MVCEATGNFIFAVSLLEALFHLEAAVCHHHPEASIPVPSLNPACNTIASRPKSHHQAVQSAALSVPPAAPAARSDAMVLGPLDPRCLEDNKSAAQLLHQEASQSDGPEIPAVCK
jgi:hypothetical protein